jgi:hypothetical protein
MKSILKIALVLLIALPCLAFEWPADAPQVNLNNRRISVSWRDGRPIAQRDEVFNFLKIPREGEPDVDLIGELEKLKTKIMQKADGTIDVTVIREVVGGAEPIAPTRGSSQARRFKAEFQAQEQAKKMAPRLVAGGYRYVADTEYIRAFVVVTNQGQTASRGTSARGEFIDWFGKPFAVHTLPVPPLEPGESQEMTFFSMVRKDEANEKADKYTLRVTFASQGGVGRRLDGTK